jgi:hypothetical protein
MDEYCGIERRREVHFTDEQIEQIAEKAASKAMSKLTDEAYRAIGKGVTERLFWIVGVLAVAGYFWAQQKGLIK